MGGIPDGYLLNAKTKVLTPLKSRHLPLGIIGDREFDDEFTDYDMALGDLLRLKILRQVFLNTTLKRMMR